MREHADGGEQAMEPIWEYTIKLIRFVLNGDVPELPENIDFEKLFAFGKSHGVENMLYVGLRDLHIDVPEETMQKFKTAYEMQIMVEATQALELEAISEAFEEAGIDHVPLKGSVIKYLYPMPDYRKSGDIDILIRPEDEAKTRPILEKCGYAYNYIFEEHEAHAEYEKRPYLILEIHRTLMGHENRAYAFSTQVWNYVTLHKNHMHCYILDANFLYVYLVSHIAKHLSEGGAGIKLIADLWLMKRKTNLNQEKVSEFLRQAQLVDINNYLDVIIDKWFIGIDNNSTCIQTLEKYIFEGGSFGTVAQNVIIKASQRKNKVTFVLKYKMRNIFKDIFEPYSYMKQYYPVLIKQKYLLPIMWIYRCIMIPFKQKDKMLSKLNSYKNIKINDETDFSKIYEAVRSK